MMMMLHEQVEVCSLYTTPVAHLSISVCVLSLAADSNLLEAQSSRCLLGACALIFVVTVDSLHTAQVINCTSTLHVHLHTV